MRDRVPRNQIYSCLISFCSLTKPVVQQPDGVIDLTYYLMFCEAMLNQNMASVEHFYKCPNVKLNAIVRVLDVLT